MRYFPFTCTNYVDILTSEFFIKNKDNINDKEVKIKLDKNFNKNLKSSPIKKIFTNERELKFYLNNKFDNIKNESLVKLGKISIPFFGKTILLCYDTENKINKKIFSIITKKNLFKRKPTQSIPITFEIIFEDNQLNSEKNTVKIKIKLD